MQLKNFWLISKKFLDLRLLLQIKLDSILIDYILNEIFLTTLRIDHQYQYQWRILKYTLFIEVHIGFEKLHNALIMTWRHYNLSYVKTQREN